MTDDHLTRRRALGLAAAASLAAAVPASFRSVRAAPTAAPDERTKWFAGGTAFVRLALEIAKPDVDALRANRRGYVKAQLRELDGPAYADVAVRLRGSEGSVRTIDQNPGFTLNLDKFTDGQAFHGMDKFSVNNCIQDDTFVSELLAGEVYRAAGVPASLCGHAAVTLNGRSLGFYLLKEGHDKTFLKTHFGGTDGNFYEGGFLKEIDQPMEVDAGKHGVKDAADIKALVEAVREKDLARRFDRTEQLLDLPKFLAYLAVQVAIWDFDGYALHRNNFRIYHDPKANKLTFFPSGMDQVFGDPAVPLVPNFEGLVARKLVETPEGRRRFLAALRRTMEEAFVVAALHAKLDALQARLPALMKEANPKAAAEYPRRLSRLRDGIRKRHKTLGEQLKAANQ